MVTKREETGHPHIYPALTLAHFTGYSRHMENEKIGAESSIYGTLAKDILQGFSTGKCGGVKEEREA